MSILLCILISIAVNLDNFLIGINLGLKNRKLSLFNNIIIALMTALTTFTASLVTWLISDIFAAASSAFGAAFLIIFGVYCLCLNDSETEITEKYMELTVAKTVTLGLVLSANCIPPAFSAGMLGISPLIIGLYAGIFSFLCMFLSNHFGSFLGKFKYVTKLTPLSNGLLILTGLIELILLL